MIRIPDQFAQDMADHLNTPIAVPGVGVIVCEDGAWLPGLRKSARGRGTWVFPGGKVDPGEDPPGTIHARRAAHEPVDPTRRYFEIRYRTPPAVSCRTNAAIRSHA